MIKKILLVIMALACLSGYAEAKVKKKIFTLGGHPVELRGGNAEQRVRQNKKANELGIIMILNTVELATMVEKNLLVELTNTDYYDIDRGARPAKESPKSPSAKRVKKKNATVIECPPKENRVFVRPWVETYVDQLAKDYFVKFHKKLKITSGTRTMDEQTLMRTKGSCYYTPYAATASSLLEESLHLRGNTIDISRAGMTSKEVKWMRAHLISDKKNGVEVEVEDEDNIELEADPIEERICYHIVVFPINK